MIKFRKRGGHKWAVETDHKAIRALRDKKKTDTEHEILIESHWLLRGTSKKKGLIE